MATEPTPSGRNLGAALQLGFRELLPPTTQTNEKQSGRVMTPVALAEAMCAWAIRSPQDVVVDLGVGDGVFALRAVESLQLLGADEVTAARQIYGTELDPEVLERGQNAAKLRYGTSLPNVVCANFYETSLPIADAVVGNPPYIRRHHQVDAMGFGQHSGMLLVLRMRTAIFSSGRAPPCGQVVGSRLSFPRPGWI